MNLGEILDRTIQFYRSRFLAFFGISAIPTAAILVLFCGLFLGFAWVSVNSAASPVASGVVAILLLIAAMLLGLPVYVGAAALAMAAVNHAAARAWLGERITIRGAYKDAWPRGWRYIGLYLLWALIVYGVPAIVWIVLVILTAAGSALARQAGLGGVTDSVLVGLGVFVVVAALAGYCIWMLLRLALAFPACVVEQIGVVAALKRSATLTSGTRGRIFVLYLLGGVLNWLITMGLFIVAVIVVALIPGSNRPERQQALGTAMLFIVYGASFAVQALTRPVYGIALMLFYFDQRIRLEGFDIEWMMQQAGLVVPAAPPSEPAPWMPPGEPAAPAAATVPEAVPVEIQAEPAEAVSSPTAEAPPEPANETALDPVQFPELPPPQSEEPA
jgi:hypothetical protein